VTYPGAPAIVLAIQRAVCEHYGIARAELLSARRDRRLAWPRQEAMALAAARDRLSTTLIGRCFGRDHTTVLHAIRAVADRAGRDPAVGARLDLLRRRAESFVKDMAEGEDRARRLSYVDRVGLAMHERSFAGRPGVPSERLRPEAKRSFAGRPRT